MPETVGNASSWDRLDGHAPMCQQVMLQKLALVLGRQILGFGWRCYFEDARHHCQQLCKPDIVPQLCAGAHAAPRKTLTGAEEDRSSAVCRHTGPCDTAQATASSAAASTAPWDAVAHMAPLTGAGMQAAAEPGKLLPSRPFVQAPRARDQAHTAAHGGGTADASADPRQAQSQAAMNQACLAGVMQRIDERQADMPQVADVEGLLHAAGLQGISVQMAIAGSSGHIKLSQAKASAANGARRPFLRADATVPGHRPLCVGMTACPSSAAAIRAAASHLAQTRDQVLALHATHFNVSQASTEALMNVRRWCLPVAKQCASRLSMPRAPAAAALAVHMLATCAHDGPVAMLWLAVLLLWSGLLQTERC